MIKRWFAYALALAAFLAGGALGIYQGEQRAVRVDYASFHRGIFSACIALYGEPYECNEFVASAIEYAVYGDPYWLMGYAGPE